MSVLLPGEEPSKLRMDGPERISIALAQWAEKNKVELEFIRPDNPTDKLLH
ncbi:hypothetical protein VIC_005026 [Vibrio coralliilyticus ATCC BAA-450]|nr:hypothetical protein VIC_005026 [Vibrio coralliilyticus ATCC BAA-450]